MDTKIKLYQWDKIEASLKEKIQNHPLLEWGHLDFIKNTKWAEPKWSIVCMDFSTNELLCFVNLVFRKVKFDESELAVIGISNLIVMKGHRGAGLGKLVMERAQDFIKNNSKCELGLLLCADDVSKFYEKLGWRKCFGKLFFDQPASKKSWDQNVYLYPVVENKNFKPSRIDLRGLPW